MRLLTYNLWHGLSPSNVVAFEALEPTGRRELREKLQLELLQDLAPNICFFQEVNPVVQRVNEFAKHLGMSANFQPDLVGLKLLGLGFPYNLNSGLVTLATESFGLKKLEGLSLDRPNRHLVHSWASWQLKEERFALISETMLPKWGRVLLIDTHLHHGLELTPEFQEDFEKLAKELELSEPVIAEIRLRIAAGNERRKRELETLLKTIEKYQKRYEVIILGGDFNASPDSHVGDILMENGFRDVWSEANPTAPGLSFDGTRNQANHMMQSRFPLTVVVEDLSFSQKTKDALVSLAKKQEARPRRIDYLWIRTNSLELKVTKAELVGLPNEEGLAASDHFGVCADIEVM